MHSTALLPKANYLPKINIDCLLEHLDFYLIRRVDNLLENVYDETIGYFKVEAFLSNDERKSIELPGMSMNLLCLHCNEDSTSFRTTGLGSDSWDGVTIIAEEDIPTYCEKNGPHINIYIPILGTHNHKYDVVYQRQGDIEKMVKKLGIGEYRVTKTKDDKEFVVAIGSGIIEITHRPTMLNYWHFELDCKIGDKIIPRKQNATQKSSLTLLIEQLFSMSATIDIPDPKNFDPTDCYLKAS